jgi:Ca2+-dependent lipid-binding protein
MDIFGKSDPFVVLHLIDSRNVSKTTIKDKNLDPEWNEDFRFPVYNPARQALYLIVKDHDVAADDDIGSVEITLATLPIGRVVDQWYTPRPAKGVKNAGELHLRLQVAIPSVTPFQEWQLPPIGPGPYVLNFRVISADEIEKMDTLGKTDPYFVITAPSGQFKTSVKQNTLTPRYDEDFRIPISNAGQDVVRILLRDEDVAVDEDISYSEILVAILPFGEVVDAWIDLTPVEKVKRGGRVHVIFHFANAQAAPFVAGGSLSLRASAGPVLPPLRSRPRRLCSLNPLHHHHP